MKETRQMDVDVDQHTRVHAEATGRAVGAGPAVVFNHGVLMDGGMWRHQVDALADRYTCITWDERGHGRTRTDGSAFDYWDSARDLLAVLDAVGVREAVLVGHSQGGFLSLRAALLAPGRVRGLVLVPAHAQALDAGTQAAFTGIKGAWQADGPAPVQDALLGMLVGVPALYPALAAQWEQLDRNAIGSVFDALIGLDDVTEKVKAIEAPALVVHGGADPAMPVELGRDLFERLGNGVGFEVVDGAGHTPALTHTDAVTALLERFLSEHVAAAEER